jgi:hypothetical protein
MGPLIPSRRISTISAARSTGRPASVTESDFQMILDQAIVPEPLCAAAAPHKTKINSSLKSQR